jgi:hypothetical protein
LEDQNILGLQDAGSRGDPVVEFAAARPEETAAFALLRDVVTELEKESGPPTLSGLKTQLRKRDDSFSEKRFGYSGFLQFVRAAAARGVVELDWNAEVADYQLSLPGK